ncbi:MAG: trans-2,3-dihydro-3-hydroxyanthranilate isomerase [Nocardioidaceae bacterium]|nr:trans-2,3-dihydro-3-hydroxyanthranilate isomerase [Nocardioidaceae bacterium]
MADSSLSYVLVDVFTRRPFAGNQLAVVLGADGLSTYQMQAIAAEFQLSETTFPVALTAEDVASGADYRVRIFTARQEIAFAGHPTLGTAWVLANRGLLEPGARSQACGAGLVGLQVPAREDEPLELRAQPRDLSAPLSEAATVGCATSVGLAADDVVGDAVVAGCGLSFVHLPVSRAAIGRAKVRLAEMSDVDLGGFTPRDQLIGLNVHAVSATEPAPDPGSEAGLSVRSRVFVPGPTVPEDPATGSAAVGLGVALVATGRAAPDGVTRYEIEQGVELGRPSYLSGRVEASGGVASMCWVAGRVVAIAEGKIAGPDPGADRTA